MNPKFNVLSLFTALLAIALLLGACGGQPAAEESAEPAASETPSKEATENEATEESADNSEPSLAAEGFPITVTDAYRHDVTLNAPPANMICLVVHCSWTLAFIGEAPEATLDYDGFNDIFDHPNYFDYFDEVTSVDVTFVPASEDGPDYEEILAFEPDFVWVNAEEQYTALAEFVPTYQQSFDVSTVDAFFGDARNAARIFGKEGTAEANIAALLQRAEAYATASGRTLSIYYGFPTDKEGSSFWLQQGGIICLVVPEEQCASSTEDKWEEYSLEGLLALDPGVLIIEDVQGDRAETVEILNQNPLWQELSAFKNDRIFVLNRLITAPRPTNPLSFKVWLDGVMTLAYPDIFDGPLTEEQVQEILSSEGDDSSPKGFPLTITDGAGRELTFDKPPERVIALWNGNFGQLAALGVYPVATNASEAWLSDSTYYLAGAETIPSVEAADGSIDLELVASFEPDLILGLTEEEAQQLEGIAPVFVNAGLNYQDVNAYQENLRVLGRIFDIDEAAEAAITDFENRLAAYQHMVENETKPTVLIFRAWGDQSFYAYTVATAACLLLDEVASCKWENPAGGIDAYQTSYEGALSLDPDVILLGHNSNFTDEDIENLFTELEENLLWNELSAVKNDRVVYVEGYENQSVNNLASAVKFLDVIVPRIYPDIFDGPLTEEQVQEIVGSETAATDENTDTYPLTVTDVAGHELTLESAPKSVMCMWNGCVSDMAFVGVMPAAVTKGVEDLGGHPSHFGEAFSDVTLIPREEDLPNLEELLAFEPDLVVGNTDGYEATNQFVPSYEQNYETATLELFFFDARNYARMFGLQEETEARIERLLQRAEAYGIASGREKSIYFGFPNDAEGSSWAINGGDATCGFIQPEGQCTADYNDEWQDVSIEGLLAIDPDVFIIEDHGGEYGEEARTALANLEENPLWQELTAVQNEQIHLIPRAISRPGYPLTLELWLDEIMPLAYPNIFPEPLTDEQVQEILTSE
ncbi:MAG: ABC transporter substrate-binding protein [Chloroflexales bacterium]|nr:ABC transporter substrate-binding protein [Chloroflexales bacterium]